ncbi:hypothetical protein KCU71_g9141, partial [Aureobasidium melanogenum]
MSSDKEQHQNNPTAQEMEHTKYDAEKEVKRNPHPDFKKVEASRPDWPEENKWHYTKIRNP